MGLSSRSRARPLPLLAIVPRMRLALRARHRHALSARLIRGPNNGALAVTCVPARRVVSLQAPAVAGPSASLQAGVVGLASLTARCGRLTPRCPSPQAMGCFGASSALLTPDGADDGARRRRALLW